MKGIVFNLLEDVVSRQYGDETWARLLDEAGDDGVYTSLGSYADDKVFALVGAAARALGQSEDHVLRWFGRQSMPLLAERYPMFFAGLSGTRPFLLTLNDIIHPEVRKLYPGAYVPVFDFDGSSPEMLAMGYRSERKLCAGAWLHRGRSGPLPRRGRLRATPVHASWRSKMSVRAAFSSAYCLIAHR